MKHIPNLLSLFRICLIPFILRVYLTAQEPGHYILAGLLLAVSGITDVVDGAVARKFKWITNLGKVLDPIADKLTQISVAVGIWLRHESFWPLPIFLIVKEAAIGLCGLWIYRKEGVVSSARWYGKLATVIYYIVIMGLVTFPWILEGKFVWIPILLVAVAMFFSGVRYAIDFNRDLRAGKPPKNKENPGMIGEKS